jgi:glycosyltransferase involved in cell wall biosynthesis
VTASPRVTVGMPVHNGGSTLARALASVRRQTYKNLEIVVSDNASTDETPAIGRRAAAEDARVRYFRQERPLPAWENFRFVLDQATGDYFFWAADDDLHSPDYVETLVAALSSSPGAVLAVTDVVRFHPDTDPEAGTLVPYAGAGSPRSYAQLLRKVILSSCSEFYGLFRIEHLRSFPWTGFDYGPDHILLFHVLLHGDVVHGSGALFFESVRRTPKPRRERVAQGFYRNMGRFRMVRFAGQMAMVGASARQAQVPVSRAGIFAYSYLVLRLSLTKVYLYEHAPAAAVRLWRRLRAEPATPPSRSSTVDGPLIVSEGRAPMAGDSIG